MDHGPAAPVVRAIFAQQNPTRDKRRAIRDPTLLQRKETGMEYFVVLGTAFMIACYAFLIGRALREIERQ